MSETISHNFGLLGVLWQGRLQPFRWSLMDVLVVDDEELVRSSVCEYLESVGYDLIAASSGQHALELAQQIGPSIQAVISDVEMPDLSGPAMWEHLKLLIPSQCRILFISGSGNVPEQFPGLPGDLLSKPFSMRELEEKAGLMINPAEQ